jgi:5-formyltetrahydrofolate cyclo-ligase
MTKQELRRYLLDLRKNLSPIEYHERNEACLELLKKELVQRRFKTIHMFLPIAQNSEPNTWQLTNWFDEQLPAVKVVVPKSDFKHNSLINYEFDDALELETNKLGIPEPIKGNIIPPSSIDLVLLPMLGFDLRGYRLGYGKGFYDRFLTNDCRPDVQKMGICLLSPLDEFPFEDIHDVKMDVCVTPWKVYQFQ